MSPKNILVLSLTTILMSSSPVFAKSMGAETGGGGDAVVVNGEVILRDLVAQESVEVVESNIKFLQKIKNFKKIVEEIAKVNPEFASEIISDLAKAKLHISNTSLPLLPYYQTTIASGAPAQIQLATRTGQDIIFAPEFFENDYAPYTLIHESLHGLLSNNAGPAHHQRVRNIVNYLFNNRSNLTASQLKVVLENNNYSTRDDKSESHVWNKELDSEIRCYLGVSAYRPAVVAFESVSCVDSKLLEKSIKDSNWLFNEVRLEVSKVIEARFPGINKLEDDLYKLKFESSLYVSELDLRKDNFFNPKIKTVQQELCWNSNYNHKKLLALKLTIEKKNNEIETLNNMFDKANLSNEIRKDLTKSFRRANGLFDIQKIVNDLTPEVESNIKTAEENALKCQKQYPN